MTKETQAEIELLKEKIAKLEQDIAGNPALKEKFHQEEGKPIHNLYKWKAPERVFAKRTKSWYSTVGAVSFFGIAWALLTNNPLLILTILVILVLFYALSMVPPNIVEHAITNKGLKISGELFQWKEIKYFWVSDRQGELTFNVELEENKGRLVLLAGEGDVNLIISEIIKHEEYKEPRGVEGIISHFTEGKRKKLTDFSS